MARSPITATEPEVTLQAPDSVLAGEEVIVRYEPVIHGRDYIAIVPLGAPEDTRSNYKRAGRRTEATISAPDEPGDYEIRYVLEVNKRVIVRQRLTVE